jgi:Chaperone of endosialidase
MAGASGAPRREEQMRHTRVGLRASMRCAGVGLITAGVLAGLSGAAAAGETVFVGVTPCRAVDTRGNGFAGPFGPPSLPASVPRDFPLAGQCGIPAAAQAVSLNVTATNTQGPGFLLLYPQGGAQPLVSTLNYVAGETVANAAIVPLGAGGVTVVAGVSGTELILDVNGYFTDSLVHASGLGSSLFVGLGPGTLGTAGGLGNTAVGTGALSSTTSGGGNTAVGNLALFGNTTGFGNIAIGSAAGSAPTNGSSNIHIGNNGEAGDTATIRIGSFFAQTRAFMGGIHNVTPAGAAVPVMVDASGQLGTGPVFSTRRVKIGIEDIGERSRGVHSLRPVTFHYRTQPDGPLQYGLIAEEVAEVYPDLVGRDTAGEPESVRYEMLPSLLLNELQRQERVLTEKDRELRAQAERLQAQEARLAELATTVAELAAELARSRAQGPAAGHQ